MRRIASLSVLTALLAVAACDEPQPTGVVDVDPELARVTGSGSFRYEPLVPFTGAAACLDPSVPQLQPFQLPAGFSQTIIGRQSDLVTQNSEVNFDMLKLNETGPEAGRYLYRTHEVRPSAALSRVDLWTGENELLVERFDWESSMGWYGRPGARSSWPRSGSSRSTPTPTIPPSSAASSTVRRASRRRAVAYRDAPWPIATRRASRAMHRGSRVIPVQTRALWVTVSPCGTS